MCKILIADDEYLEREVIKKVVSSVAGATVIGECNSGRKAIELFFALKPDIVFLNMGIGEVNGIDVARKIRAENSSVVIVLTTSYCDEHVLKQLAHSLDIDEYLLKPIKPSKIKGIVNKFNHYPDETASLDISIESKKQIKYYPKHLMSKEVKDALTYIENNYQENLRLEDVAQKVYMSKCYFSRLFKKEVGVAFSNYLTYKKIDEAKKILENTNKSILSISLYLNFKEQNYFSRVFKQCVGQTPSKYRASVKAVTKERRVLASNYTNENFDMLSPLPQK